MEVRMLDAIGTILVGVAMAVILAGMDTTITLRLPDRLHCAGRCRWLIDSPWPASSGRGLVYVEPWPEVVLFRILLRSWSCSRHHLLRSSPSCWRSPPCDSHSTRCLCRCS